MPTECPTCKSPLDPAHAPVARVRAAKVVSYCSKACADNAGDAVPSQPEPDLSKKSESETREPEKKHAIRWLSGSRRRRIVWASAVIMVGGMAVAIIPVIAPTASHSVSAADGSLTIRAEPLASAQPSDASQSSAVKETPQPTNKASREEIRGAAIRELERALREESSRYQRLAAIALARLSHPGAAKFLSEELSAERSELRRIDIAYGMALGGNKAGREHLKGELKSKRRDVRIDAARRLVQLGDESGRVTLVPMLGIRSHRVGAAKVLARLGDERGLSVLRELLANADSSEESKMRAAVGLGRAGESSVAPRLKEILAEGKYIVDAAGALAALGDKAATPALLRQLELSSMRVRAAEGLVRIEQDVELSLLASALESGSVDGRIAAAEAILVLTAKAGTP